MHGRLVRPAYGSVNRTLSYPAWWRVRRTSSESSLRTAPAEVNPRRPHCQPSYETWPVRKSCIYLFLLRPTYSISEVAHENN